MTQPLKNCLRYWENTLFHNRFLMSPSALGLVESTIKHLKRLETLEPPPEQVELVENSDE